MPRYVRTAPGFKGNHGLSTDATKFAGSISTAALAPGDSAAGLADALDVAGRTEGAGGTEGAAASEGAPEAAADDRAVGSGATGAADGFGFVDEQALARRTIGSVAASDVRRRGMAGSIRRRRPILRPDVELRPQDATGSPNSTDVETGSLSLGAARSATIPPAAIRPAPITAWTSTGSWNTAAPIRNDQSSTRYPRGARSLARPHRYAATTSRWPVTATSPTIPIPTHSTVLGNVAVGITTNRTLEATSPTNPE